MNLSVLRISKKMSFIRNFNKNLLKKCEITLISKKEVQTLKTVIVK